MSAYMRAKMRDNRPVELKGKLPDLDTEVKRQDSRPKSAFATPAPKKSSKMALLSEKSNKISKKEDDLASFNAERIINTAYLAKAHPDKCIGCATCMSPQHRIISYKYPKKM